MQKLVNGELVDLTLEEIAARQAEEAATKTAAIANHLPAYRWQVENGGITINGVTVQTDANSRANILGAKELGISIKWKTPDGFVTLTAEQVAGIATAVGMHIQKCFEVEAALFGQTFESIEALETAFNEAMEG